MRVRILRAIDDHEINVRYTDEIAESLNMTDDELGKMEAELKSVGRFWLSADTYCRRATEA
jgi:hypothetical protein